MNRKSGFTLVEVLVVVAIVGLLAAMATLAISKVMDGSRQKTAESELEIIGDAILRLAWDTGTWPNGNGRQTPGTSGIADLSATSAGLFGNDGTYPTELWSGPYYGHNTVDPWGNNYYFIPAYVDEDGITVRAVGSEISRNQISKESRNGGF